MPEWLDKITGIFLVAFFFGFSIFIHEFGHLLAAIWRGFHVEKFSIGFGHKIWGFKHKGIEYIIGWLPFGGYVALPQLEPTDQAQTRDGAPLPRPKPLDKIIVAIAGPLFNIMFAFVLGFILWKTGKPMSPPVEYIEVIDLPSNTIDYQKGLRNGDKIITVNGEKLENSEQLIREYILAKGVDLEVERDGKITKIPHFVPVEDPHIEKLAFPPFTFEEKRKSNEAKVALVFDKDQKTKEILPALQAGLKPGDKIIRIDDIKVNFQEEVGEAINAKKGVPVKLTIIRDGNEIEVTLSPKKIVSDTIGISFVKFPEVFSTEPEMAAYQSGIRKWDKILTVNGQELKSFEEMEQAVQTNKGKTINIKVKRQEQILEFPVMVYYERYLIGIRWQNYLAYLNPYEQVKAVFVDTFRTLSALVNRKLHPKLMSGPLGISKGIYDQWQSLGIIGVLAFIFMINISLAVFNLLPLPVLDGGHIFVAVAELVSRRKVPANILQPLTIVFVLLFFSLMIYVTINDFNREKDLIKFVKIEPENDTAVTCLRS